MTDPMDKALNLRSLRSLLYRGARFLGDVQAIQRGPRAIAERIARKIILRRTGRTIDKL